MSTFLPVDVTIHQSDDETNDPLNRSFYKVENGRRTPQSAKTDWGFFFLRRRSPHPALSKADHKSSSRGIPQARGW
jgi:hypothetical protein